MVVATAMVATAALVIAIVVPRTINQPRHQAPKVCGESFAGTLEAIRTPSFWSVSPAAHWLFTSFCVLVVRTLGRPILGAHLRLQPDGQSNILLVAVVAQERGAFLWGMSDRVFQQLQDPGHDPGAG